MILSVGCRLSYQVLGPSAAFTFNVLANTDAQQQIVSESILGSPPVPTEQIATTKCNRVLRTEVPQGPFELQYQASIEVNRPSLPTFVKADNPGRLPLSILTYMLPSRYCESDRFAPMAWELFGQNEDRDEQVRAICRWVDQNLTYAPLATDARTSAWDVWQGRKGVCRDYAHVAIAFCRALSIPARYVGGFAAGLEPMDFHACFEAYLGGEWHLFDPTDGIPADHIVIISRGRDAASAGLTTIFGKVQIGPVTVSCVPAAPG